MSEKYNSKKQEVIDSKHQAGTKKISYVKASDYIPSVFKTPVNEKWLDATFDQMLSKGKLDDFDGWIGSRHGKDIDPELRNVYLDSEKNNTHRDNIQLSPAIISTDEFGKITTSVTFDDILRNIKFNFDEYNLNSAYQTQRHVYMPPISIKKFTEYLNYYWTVDVPVYESNGVIDLSKEGSLAFEIDGFFVENGMAIKDITGITYIVSGVGTGIRFVPYMDSIGTQLYTDASDIVSVTVGAEWSHLNDSTVTHFNQLNKEYIVISRADTEDTDWSRSNHWVEESTLRKIIELVEPDLAEREKMYIHYFSSERQARRPIIEFNAGLTKADGLVKTDFNQPPLFKLYDKNGTELSDNTAFPNNTFISNKLFSYAEGTGVVDKELGFKLKYTDTGYSSDIVFVDNLLTEEVKYSVLDINGRSTGEVKVVEGPYYYEHNNTLKTSYVPVTALAGAPSCKTVVMKQDTYSVDVRATEWEKPVKFIFRPLGTGFTVDTIMRSGAVSANNTESPLIVISANDTYQYIDTVLTDTLQVWNMDEDVQDINNLSVGLYKIGYDFATASHLIVVEDDSAFYHRVFVNGELLEYSADNYVISGDSVVFQPGVVAVDEQVDIEYTLASNVVVDDIDMHIPDTINNNATNETVSEITLNNTRHHWQSIKESFSTDLLESLGINDGYRVLSPSKHTGTIYVTRDISIEHDLTYATPELNITAALIEQASDWQRFKTRFVNQAERLYLSDATLTTIEELANAVLDAYVLTRQGTKLYIDSGMLASHPDYIPQSLSRLALTKLVEPYIDYERHVVVCHDGSTFKFGENETLDVYGDITYNVKASALLYVETKIFEKLSYTIDLSCPMSALLPNPYYATWYNQALIDNAVEKYFTKHNPEPDFGEPNAIEPNFSALLSKASNSGYEVYGELEKLPGSWQGAYTILFGTHMPHKEPWVMLGFSKQPDFWSDFYPTTTTWDDVAKVDALKEALVTGVVNGSATHHRARYSWNWNAQFPVDEFGELINPIDILDPDYLLTVEEQSKAFEYGDWSGDELTWRLSVNGQAAMTDIIVKMNPVLSWKWIANGVKLAQKNYAIRNNIAIDIDQMYANVDTRLSQKIGGFTAKQLLDISAESSRSGMFRVESEDYSLGMHRSAPTNMITASVVYIQKVLTDTGFAWEVRGISPNKQQFDFYPPISNSSNDYTLVNLNNTGATVKRYKKFTRVVNTAEYGARFSKVQDVHNFIMGYRTCLEDNGYFPSMRKELVADMFAKWSITAEENDVYTVVLGDEIKFVPPSGVAIELGTLPLKANSVYNDEGQVITSESLDVNRTIDGVIVRIDNVEQIGSITFAVVEYEHLIVFNNRTTFNKVLFDKSLNVRQNRLKISGQRTMEWTGKKTAPGFLVFEDKILENFDSSVEALNDLYRYDTHKFNSGVERAENLMLGNIDRSWTHSLGMDNNTTGKFHQGIIRDKGTKDVASRLDRSSGIGVNISDASVVEEWMFKMSAFGDVTNSDAVEYEIRNTELTSAKQGIYFKEPNDITNTETNVLTLSPSDVIDGRRRVVNYKKVEFETDDYESSALEFTTAGELRFDEASHTAFSIYDLPAVFDDSADYANIETWSPTVSYNRGDMVRYNGKLWKCVVDYTGLSAVSEGINLLGTARNPVFPAGSTASIDGISVTFGKNVDVYSDIVVTSAADITPFTSTAEANIVIDGYTVYLEQLDNIEVIRFNPAVTGTVTNPVIDDVRNQTLKITTTNNSGSTTDIIDFTDVLAPEFAEPNTATSTFTSTTTTTTPTETITGVATQDTYTISESFDVVTEVTVDGNIETDYTIVGSDITFNSFVFTGGEEIVISMEYDVTTQIETKQDTFPVSQQLGQLNPYFFQVDDVKISGNSVGFSVVGNSVVLDTPANNGVNVIIYVRGVRSYNLAEIVNEINSQSAAPGLIASDNAGKLLITWEVPDNTAIESEITIEHDGTINADVGFSTDANNETSDVAVKQVVYGQDKITALSAASSINAALIPNISASAIDDRLVITKTNTSVVNSVVTILGDNVGDLNIAAGTYSATVTTDEIENTALEAINIINAAIIDAGTSGASLSLVDGSIRVITNSGSVDLGDEANEFNSIAGLPYGVQENINTTIANMAPDVAVSEPAWEDYSSFDSALFNIWVTDDSALGYETINDIQVQYDGWNLFQVMNLGLYSHDDEECSICAGTATSDGNDAQVTTNTTHGLQEGDLVMLLNTTTTPNIDGIHTVTRVSPTNDKVFYIDRYIEKCGTSSQILVIRPVRFNTKQDMETLVNNSSVYDLTNETLAFTNNDTNLVRSANVYNYTDGTFSLVRQTYTRPSETDLLNVRIYDGYEQQTSIELEVFDPLRGIIPGVADREITFRSPIDFAVYTNSTSSEYENGKESYAWGEEQIGQVWWDTSTVRYYDYDQSTIGYRTKMWGEQFPGSSIDVYEWTKSSISPDKWDESVGQTTYGDVVSGEVYKIYDVENAEYNYYYVEQTEWNRALGKYETAYYFWVKNKITNTDPKRMLTAKQIADIISNPTAAGINWCAITGDKSIIIANASQFIKADGSVIQINLVPKLAQHNNWMAVREDQDLIPDFWYMQARNNLVGYSAYESESGSVELVTRLPSIYLNRFNRYGNDSVIGQGWFEEIWQARRESLSSANTLLNDINAYSELADTWWRNITRQEVREVWNWTSYVHPLRNSVRKPSLIITQRNQLFDSQFAGYVDTSKHQVVMFKEPERVEEYITIGEAGIQEYSLYDIRDEIVSLTINGVEYFEAKDWEWVNAKTIRFLPYNDGSQEDSNDSYGIVGNAVERGYDFVGGETIVVNAKTLDRSEIFEYIDGEWILTEKNNSTIRINDILWKTAQSGAWDMQAWDLVAWDNTFASAQYYIIKAFREDLFIRDYVKKFNRWFLDTVQYAISEHKQVDWVYKTTYVSLEVETPINAVRRKFVRNNVDEITAFVYEVKPFHTKIRSTYDINTATEDMPITIDESLREFDIHMNFADYEGEFDTQLNDIVVSTFADESAPFVDETAIVDGGNFIDPELYNWNNRSNSHRRTEIDLRVTEGLRIAVQTNTTGDVVDSDTRTIVYYQDDKNVRTVYAWTAAGEMKELTFTESDILQLNDSGSSILTPGTNILPQELNGPGSVQGMEI